MFAENFRSKSCNFVYLIETSNTQKYLHTCTYRDAKFELNEKNAKGIFRWFVKGRTKFKYSIDGRENTSHLILNIYICYALCSQKMIKKIRWAQ